MAKRVNKQFLIALIVVLVVIIGGLTVVVVTLNKINNNPTRLVAQAEAALKKSRYKLARQFYQRAALVAVREHLPQAAEILLKLGDLDYKTTAMDLRHYGAAINEWQGAVEQNPRLLAGWEHLLKASYQAASEFGGNSTAWAPVRSQADHVITLDPKNATAYMYRAQARLRSVSGLAALTNRRFISARTDLRTACKLQPDNVEPYALLAQVYIEQAEAAHAQNLIDAAGMTKLADKGIAVMKGFIARHPRNIEALLRMAAIYRAVPGREKDAARTLALAEKLAPDNTKVLGAQAQQLLVQGADPMRVAELFKKIIALRPDVMSNYAALGEMLRRANHPGQAISYLKEGLTHPTPGGGLIPELNQSIGLRINEMLMGAYLQLAMEAPASSNARNGNLAHASDALAWVAQRMPQSAWVYVARARLRFVQGRLDAADRWIKKADDILAPGDPRDIHLWLSEKQLLAQIYEMRGQSGSALAIFKEIQKYLPGQPSVALAQAQLIVQERPAEALAVARKVLTEDPKNATALNIEAFALANLNRRTELATLLRRLDTAHNFSLAQLKARLELAEHRYTEAQQTIAPWLAQSPGDPQVVTVAYAAMAGLNQRAAAQALIATALKAAPSNLQFILLNNQLSNAQSPMPTISLGPLTSNIAQISVAGGSAQQAQLDAIKKLPDPIERGLLLSRYYLSTGDNAAAEKVMAPLAAAHPDNPKVIKAEFQVALALKHFKHAGQLARHGGNLNVDGYKGALLQAQLDIAKGNSAGAAQTLAGVLKKHPNDANIKAFYGIALLSSGNVRDGVKALTGVLQAKPDDLNALTALIQYDLQSRNPADIQRARNLVNQGLAYYPLDAQFQHWHYQFQDRYGKPGPEIARRLAIYKRDPSNLDNAASLALLYMRVKNPKRAIALLLTARQSHPDNLQLAKYLANIYVLEKKPNAAQRIFETLAESRKRDVAFAGRLMLGDFYQNAGHLRQAAEVYQTALKAQPKGRYTVQRRLGDMYFNAGQFKLALSEYSSLYNAMPENRVIGLRYAETLIRDGQAAQGISVLKSRFLNKNPSDEEALVLEGFAYLRDGQKTMANTALTAALALNPHDPHALYDMATLLLLPPNPQYAQAIQDLQLLLSADASDVAAEQLLAQAYVGAGEFAEAIYEYDTIMKAAPRDQVSRAQLAELLFDLSERDLALAPGDNSDAASTLRSLQPLQKLDRLITESLSAYPSSPQWVMMQARYDLLMGRKNTAVTVAKKAFQLADRSTTAAVAYAQILLAAGDYQTAVDVTGKALALAPNTVELYMERAQVGVKLKKFAAASADFTTMLKLTGGNAAQFLTVLSAYQSAFAGSGQLAMVVKSVDSLAADKHFDPALLATARAMAQFANKQTLGALNSAKLALASNPSPVVRHAALEVAAFASYRLKQFDSCRGYYQDILKVNPDDPAILNNLAYLLAVKLHQPAAAVPYIEHCNALLVKQAGGTGQYAHNGAVLDTLGWIRFLNGDLTAAAAALDRSLRYNPPATAYYHLARVLVAQKDITRAVKILKQGIKKAQATDDPILPRAMKLLKQLHG